MSRQQRRLKMRAERSRGDRRGIARARQLLVEQFEERRLLTISVTPLGTGTPALTPTDLAQALVGSGISISNVQYTGANVAAGLFSGGGTKATDIIGFDAGIVLGSGSVKDAEGPNSADGTTTSHSLPGDPDLNTLSGVNTFDAAILEFDFIPTSDTVTFRYVFTSEEYNEFANSTVNDAFGLLVNGVNAAIIGTGQAVSINTVNGGNPFGTNAKNSNLFRNNDLSNGGGSIDIEMDGLTVVLAASAQVNKGVTNKLKLAIADGGDRSLDSNVFIAAGSLVGTSSDFGDAPDTYKTTLVSNGPRHAITPGFQLGATIDSEADGVPGLNAVADDNSKADDEDGVKFLTNIVPGLQSLARIEATDVGFVDAWLDFNRDGVFQPTERLTGAPIPVIAGPNNVLFNVPSDANVGDSYARFRFSSTGGYSPEGFATDGEVEDYFVKIKQGATVTGQKFHDLDGDGQKDNNEPGLNGWTINLTGGTTASQVTQDVDLNFDGVIDPITERGIYEFSVNAGNYTLSESPQQGWVQSAPAAGTFTLTVGQNDIISDLAFGNFKPGTVEGLKFNDLDGDGVRDLGEPGLAGWTFQLVGTNGKGQSVALTTTSLADNLNTPNVDEAGQYVFNNVAPGNYTLTEVQQSGWVQTFPQSPSYAVTVISEFGAVAPVSVPLVFDADGLDQVNGPDGTFELFTTNGTSLGAGGGLTQEYRTAAEFNLGSVVSSPNTIIGGARLTFKSDGLNVTAPATNIGLILRGYAGDGVAQVADLNGTGFIPNSFAYGVNDTAKDLSVDVTPFIQGLIGGSQAFAGFSLLANALAPSGDFVAKFKASEQGPGSGPTLDLLMPTKFDFGNKLNTKLSISDVSVTEGNAGTTTMTFVVTLEPVATDTIEVDYATLNNSSAVSPLDYVAKSGKLTFAPGETTKNIVVTINGDTLDEIDETFSVGLSNPKNAAIVDGEGLGTILDDDPSPEISIGDASILEGNAGQKSLVFNVTLNKPSGQHITVGYATANGTASTPSDYIPVTNGTLTFIPGQTTQTVSIAVRGDTSVEGDETFFVNLSSPSRATIADNQALGTIINDDIPLSFSANDIAVTENNSGQAAATILVVLSTPAVGIATVDYSFADGTATSGSDYTATGGTLTFNPGETSKLVSFNILGDTRDEANEVFTLQLSNPTGGTTVGDSEALITINDNDPVPSLSIGDVSVAEGDTGVSPAVFTVSLSAVSDLPITVNYSTATSTASTPADFIANNGMLTFAPGEQTKEIAIDVVGDTIDEVNENFFVNLTLPVNATFSDAQATGTILDNDESTPTITIDDVTVAEGNQGTVAATFTVSLSNLSNQSVSVNYSVQDGTAAAPNDYTAASGTVTFAPGVIKQTFSVLVQGDTLFEASETFSVILSSAVGGLIGDVEGIGTITNDDQAPVFQIADVSVVEGNSGNADTMATITVMLSQASGNTASVNYSTGENSAKASSDYVTTSGTVTFLPGETSKSFTIPVVGDLVDEPNEIFFVNLTGALGATINDSQAAVTITDDDLAPTASVSDVTVTEGNTNTFAGIAVFTVTLSNPSGRVVGVNYQTSPVTALGNADYTPTSGTVVFSPGETTRTVSIPIFGDLIDESDETFSLLLTSASNAVILDGQGLGTITDDDAVPTISIADAIVAEGSTNSAAVQMTFVVTLSAASGRPVTVDFSTQAQGAGSPADYTAQLGTITFNAGQTTRTVSVPIVGDQVDEDNETFLVKLENAVNGSILDSQGLGTIIDDDAMPTLSISDVVVNEAAVSGAPAQAEFKISLSAPSGRSVSVKYKTTDQNAVSPSDYQGGEDTVVFAPGEITKSVMIPIVDDALNEVTETFITTLSNSVGAAILDSQGVARIMDNDALPKLVISDATEVEGNSNATEKSMLFTVTLSAVSGRPVTVGYSTNGITASSPADYTLVNGTLNFQPGETTKTIAVPLFGDRIDEPNERFSVILANSVGASVLDSQGVGVIEDDDATPSLSINDVRVTEGTGAVVLATFTVQLSAPSGQAVSVNYGTANGTALSPLDYGLTGGGLLFQPGETQKTFTVPVAGDSLDENDETFLAVLSNSVGASILDSQGIATIVDNDALPTLNIGDASVTEGNQGATTASFAVTLSTVSGRPVTAKYSTQNGTATEPSDFAATTGLVTFAPGETTKLVTVSVAGDLVNEANETFSVRLSESSNASILDSQGIGTIINDDALPSFSISDATVTEGNSGTFAATATFTVTLSAASGRGTSVNYTTLPGTAIGTADYQTGSGLLQFAPGETSKTITVPIFGDVLDENDETFSVKLSNSNSASILDSQGLGVIRDDDAVVTVSIGDMSILEGNSPLTAVKGSFAVTLSAASGRAVTVNYATVNDSAIAPGDYLSATGTITFQPGETVKTINISIIGDTVSEANEIFSVRLQNAVNASILDSQGRGTILNDDASINLISFAPLSASDEEDPLAAATDAAIDELFAGIGK